MPLRTGAVWICVTAINRWLCRWIWKRKKPSFLFLCHMGFRQIEVGFPAASDTEYQFVRTLIEHNLIPPQVMIQVLTPAREPIIRRTMQSLSGCKQAIVHLYNPTSRAQREQVLKNRRKKSSKLLFRQFELSKSVQQKSRGRSSWNTRRKALLPPSRILRWKSAMRWWRNGENRRCRSSSIWHPLSPFRCRTSMPIRWSISVPICTIGSGSSFRCTRTTTAAAL